MAQSDTMAQVAAKLEGTVYVRPLRESADGVLEACGFEFLALQRDFSTKAGAPVKLSGSFYLRKFNKAGVIYTLKLGLIDGLGSDETFSAPANAFVRAPRGKAPVQARRSKADNQAYALYLGSLDNDIVAAYESILTQRKLVVGFNRKPGQQDVVATLDLTVTDSKVVDNEVVREQSSDTVDDFNSCTGDLIKDVGVAPSAK